MAAPRCQKCGERTFDDEGRCRACRTFPTLGFDITDWIEARCAIPDRDQVGEPFILTDEQARYFINFYRVNPAATFDKRRKRWSKPYIYARGGQLCRPQKWGKGPLAGAHVCVEAAGPVVFDGWDANGAPVGRPEPTPIVQVTASSEDQTDNVWQALLPMIALGDFGADIPETGLLRIYLPGGGYVEPVTSAARSRLGQRVTFLVQDQTESWTKHNGGRALADTQRRNIAGMGGRWLSTCNAWNPAEGSVAQFTAEHEAAQGDVYIDDVEPPASLSIRNKAERRRALRHVYGDAYWVDLDRVDSEVTTLILRDAAQAERFFLNRKRAAESAAFKPDTIDAHVVEPATEHEGRIVIGVDGARFDDALAIVATDVLTGVQWALGIWERPDDADEDYEHPKDEVDGTVREAFDTLDVWRLYADPQYIEALVEGWQGEYGAKRVVEWRTNRPRQIAYAVRNFTDALKAEEGGVTFASTSELLLQHLKQATRYPLRVYDDKHRQMHSLGKDTPDSPRKIDGAMAAVLSWEARGDCIAAGETKKRRHRAAGFN